MDSSIIAAIISIIVSVITSALIISWRLGQHQNKVDGLETDVKELKIEMKEVNKQLTECVTKLDERTQSYAASLTKRKSPVALTDKGQLLLQRSGSDKFVLENKDELVKKIEGKDPKSAYDVQIYAREVIESLQKEDRFTEFKDFVYKEGLDLEVIFIVMSLYLRDIALPLLGYKLEEIDKYDPTVKNNQQELKEHGQEKIPENN